MIKQIKYTDALSVLKYHYLANKPAFIKRVFGYYVKNVLVGVIVTNFSSLTNPNRSKRFKKVERICRIAVIPSARGKKVASKLIKHVVKTSKDTIIECVSERLDLANLFKKCGFKTCEYISSSKEIRLYASITKSKRYSVYFVPAVRISTNSIGR